MVSANSGLYGKQNVDLRSLREKHKVILAVISANPCQTANLVVDKISESIKRSA